MLSLINAPGAGAGRLLRSLSPGVVPVAVLFFVCSQGYAEVKTTVRADTSQTVNTRLIADLGSLRAVAVDRRGASGEPRLSFGVEAGPVMFGPTSRAGLHRVVGNPLGFSAKSRVWEEATRLSLDTAMDPTSRHGGQLELFKDHIFLSAYEAAEVRSLGVNGARVGERFEVYGLSLVSSSPTADSGERWYPAKTPFAGGVVSNSAVQALVRPADTLEIRGVALLSGGAYVPPGAAGLVSGRYSGRRLDAAFAVGSEQPRYRAPDGKTPKAFRVGDGSVTVSIPAFELGGEARAVLEDRPLPQEAVHPWEYGAGVRLEAGGEEGVKGGVSLERTRHGSAKKKTHYEGRVEALLSVRTGHFFSKLRVRRRWGERHYEDAVRLQTSVQGAGLSFEQWVRIDWPDGLVLGAGGAGEAGGGGNAGGWFPGITNNGAPAELEGRAALRWRPGKMSISVYGETVRAVELTPQGRTAASSQWEEHFGFGVEVSFRIDTGELKAEDESGYLEVYGKPDDVDDGRHERPGHYRRVEADAVDE